MRNGVALIIARECAVLATTVALLAIPLEAPFNYYAAIAVLAAIPGRGYPRLMFGHGLSIAETTLFAVLISIGLTTATVFGLLLAGVRLDASTLKILAVSLAALSSVAGVLGLLLHREANVGGTDVWNAAAFVAGVLIAVTVGIVIMNLL